MASGGTPQWRISGELRARERDGRRGPLLEQTRLRKLMERPLGDGRVGHWMTHKLGWPTWPRPVAGWCRGATGGGARRELSLEQPKRHRRGRSGRRHTAFATNFVDLQRGRLIDVVASPSAKVVDAWMATPPRRVAGFDRQRGYRLVLRLRHRGGHLSRPRSRRRPVPCRSAGQTGHRRSAYRSNPSQATGSVLVDTTEDSARRTRSTAAF